MKYLNSNKVLVHSFDYELLELKKGNWKKVLSKIWIHVYAHPIFIISYMI